MERNARPLGGFLQKYGRTNPPKTPKQKASGMRSSMSAVRRAGAWLHLKTVHEIGREGRLNCARIANVPETRQGITWLLAAELSDVCGEQWTNY